MDIKTIIKEFNYGHNLKFPKQSYNKPIIIDKYGTQGYRFLKKTNPNTFEYSGITTSVDIFPLYTNYGNESYTWIYISTIDDASMSLWLKPQSKQNIYRLLKAYQNKHKIQSCVLEFARLSKVMNWGFEDAYDYYNQKNIGTTKNKYSGKSTVIVNPDAVNWEVQDIDFN